MPLFGETITKKMSPSQVNFMRQGQRTCSNSPVNESTEKRRLEKHAILQRKKKLEELMAVATQQANKTEMSRKSSRV